MSILRRNLAVAKRLQKLLANSPRRSKPIAVAKKIKAVDTERPHQSVASAAAGGTGKVKKRPPAKTPARKKTAGSKTRKSLQTQRTGELSDEQIRTRAYFIAERRHRLGLAGDASSDWLEAKRQLLSELGPR
jgi:hypothetical protein